MKLTARITVTAAMLALLFSATGCNHLKARNELVKGIAAFKNARYEEAVGNFQNAIKLDPNDEMSRLYLATAYAYQVVPNLDTPENMKTAQNAIDGFQAVLAKNPNDTSALKQIAAIYRQVRKFDESKEYYKKLAALDPKDPETYYNLGYIDWVEAYKNATTVLAADGLSDDGAGNVKMSKAACQKIKDANTGLVEDGLQYLQKAIDINPTYDDALVYYSLTLRRKADTACGDAAARKDLLAQSDSWFQKALGARKENERKLEEKNKGGVEMN
jgi:hypothetical protein